MLLIYLSGKGKLDQDAVDIRVSVQLSDELQKFLLACRIRDLIGPGFYADIGAGLLFV